MPAMQSAFDRLVSFRTALPACLVAALALSLPQTASAQRNVGLPQTRLKALSPPGGKVGTTFELKVTSGDDIDGLTSLVFNHPGIKAVPKTQKSGGKQVPVPNTFAVTIAANVPSGLYEVRAAGEFGLSNPRTFVVGRLQEVAEKEANDSTESATPVPLGATVNGVLGGRADVDYFKFDGKQGQHVILDCRAGRIDSRAEPALEFYAPDGRRIAFSRNGQRNDPLIGATLPTTGTYVVRVYDFTYQNGPDYFYRLSIHTGPHVDFVLPASGVPGTTGKFTLYGRNLPGGRPSNYKVDGQTLQKLDVQIAVPKGPVLRPGENLSPRESGLDAFSWALKTDRGESNPVEIQLAQAPAVVLEREPNDEPKQAQAVPAPVEVCGQFQDRGDVDYFTFPAKARDVFYIEVFSQRLGTTADPYLKLEQIKKDKKGQETVRSIQTSDDNTNRLATSTFNTSTDDPVYRFVVPEDGTYRISLRDRYFEARGDPRLVYRLVIRRPQRDFRVVVLPITPPRQRNQPSTEGTLALRKGENLVANVIVFRQDGFEGDVEVSAVGLPKGVHCKGTLVGKNEGSSYLVFTSDENAPEWSGLIRVVARAKVEDAAKVRAVAKAKAEVDAAEKPLPNLRKALQQAEGPLKKLQQQLAQAKAAAAKKPKDKNLANKVNAVQKQVTNAQKKRDAAKSALQTAEKRLADAQTALKKADAERKAAVQTITREARPATIVWSPVRNQGPGVSRIARSLGLSVLKESAPIQLTTDVFRVEVNQGRQVLVPTKLFRRNGFNNNVAVTVQGLPRNSRISVQNKNINKGKDSEVYRLFVATNTNPGTYTLYLQGQAQVPYRKHLKQLEAAKKEQEAAARADRLATRNEAMAGEQLKAAVKALQQAAAALKTATTNQKNAQKAVTDSRNALKQATTAQAAAAKALADAQKAVKAAQAKVAAAKKASAAKPKDANLKKALAEAQKQLADAQSREQAANKAEAQADQKVTAAQAAAKKADDALTAAGKAASDAQAKVKAAEAAKTKADAAVKAAAAKAKAATAAKKAIDQKVKQLEQTAKARNRTIYPTTTPVIIEVKPRPANLSASVPNGGNFKRGGKLQIKVRISRTNGFKGPVKLSLPLPPGVQDLAAPEVTVPADKNDGVLTVQAGKKATLGQLQNMVVRATMDFDGKAAVDAPITLKVSK